MGLSVGRAVCRELEQKMMQFAAALRRLGLAQGDKVGGAAFDNKNICYDTSCSSDAFVY
jgi:non-ribosomal peptide synthetase component E (peptide arylation enzyme)